jgi:hypothetical protein
VVDFVNNPTAAPDTSCIANMPGPKFVLPQDIVLRPGVYYVQSDIGESPPNMLVLGILLACVLLFIAEIGYLVISGIVRLVRRHERATPTDRISRLAHPLAGLVAVLNVGATVALGAILSALDTTDPLVLYFGTPTGYAPLFLIPVITAVLTVGLAILAVLAWVRRYWSVPGRVLFSLVTAAAIVYTGLMAYWDLLALLF